MNRSDNKNEDELDTLSTTNENLPNLDENIVLENVEYPVLSLRDIVIFPGNTASLFVGRKPSLEAALAAYQFNTPLVLLTQIDAKTENPELKDLYQVGTLATIKRYIVMPDGTLNLAVEGVRRIKLQKLNTFGKYYTAFISAYDFEETNSPKENINALISLISEEFKNQSHDLSKLTKENLLAINSPNSTDEFIATVIGNLEIPTKDKQKLLETPNKTELLENLLTFIGETRTKDELERKIKKHLML